MQTLIHNFSPLAQVHRHEAIALHDGNRQLSPEDQATFKQILTGKYEFVKNPIFGRANAYRKLFEEPMPIAKPDTSWYHQVMETFGESRGRRHKPLGRVLLSAAEERTLFFQFNYCRYKVCKLREKIDWANILPDLAFELLDWHRRVEVLRDQIAETNLALVLAMAKRTKMNDVDFTDLLSEGNMALLRAIDKFDAGRGFKFSTYACRAILKAFSRACIKHSKYRNMFPTDFDPKLERSDNLELKRAGHEYECADEIKQIIVHNRADLTDVEQEVIEHRFAIDTCGKPHVDASTLTLEQVGRIIGVTKERVRQIQNKALAKIRRSLEEDYLR